MSRETGQEIIDAIKAQIAENDKKMLGKSTVPGAKPVSENSVLDQNHKARPTSDGYAPVKPPSKLRIKRASEFESKKQNYLLYPYFPTGTFSIIAGDAGSTKTWFSLYIAKLITTAEEFITDMPFNKREPGFVIYQSKENNMETDVCPRLDILKADRNSILIIDDKDEDGSGMPLTLTDGRIEQAMKEYKPKAIIFDPLQSYLGAGVEMNAANEVRPIMDEIMRLASTYDCAFIIIMHLSKATTQSAVDRILGTADFKAAARSIVIIGKDPADPERRIMAHAKLSGGRFGESIAYRINSQDGVVIEGFCDLKADDIVGSHQNRGERDKPSISLEEAKDFLLEVMSENGYIKKTDVEILADERGIKKSTLYSAKDELSINSKSVGFGKNKLSWWTLWDTEPPILQDKETEQISINNA